MMGMLEEGDVYISPEAFTELKHRNLQPNYDRKKADVFSLGLVLLEAATLQDIQVIYNFQKFEIDNHELDKLIKQVRGRYDQVKVLFI